MHQASFLRTIPEDRSDASSSKAFALPISAQDNNRSLSVISDANNSSTVNMETRSATSNIAELGGGTNKDGSDGVVTPSGQGHAAAGSDNKRLGVCQAYWTKRRVYLTLGGLTLALVVLLLIGLVAIRADKKLGDDDDVAPPSSLASPPPAEDKGEQATAAPSGQPPFVVERPPMADPSRGSITQAPTPSRTTRPTDPETIASIDRMLGELVGGTDDNNNNDNPADWSLDTPRGEARHFLLYDDFLTDDIVAEGAWRVHQRFVAAELYFALGGPNWIAGNGGDDGTGATNTYLMPELSECWWFGISCSPNDREEVAIVRIELGGNNLLGRLFPELNALSSLQELDLHNNTIQGEIPNDWFMDDSSWQNLYLLDLSLNQLTGSIPAGLWDRPVLRFVYLNQNSLTGSLDDAAAATATTSGAAAAAAAATVKPRLEFVDVSDNPLAGTLPNWFRADTATSLSQFAARGCQLWGSLPDSLPNNLQVLLLSWNALSGTLPATLWTLTSLEYVELDRNQFSGNIPPPPANDDDGPGGSSSSSLLIHVWLTNNTLTGEIPDRFGQSWNSLQQLRIEDNPGLSGTLGPTDKAECAQVWAVTPTLRADCALVECVCCENCQFL